MEWFTFKQSHRVPAQDDLKLTTQLKMTVNSWPSARVAACHYTWLLKLFFLPQIVLQHSEFLLSGLFCVFTSDRFVTESPTTYAQCLLCSVTCMVWPWPPRNFCDGDTRRNTSALFYSLLWPIRPMYRWVCTSGKIAVRERQRIPGEWALWPA